MGLYVGWGGELGYSKAPKTKPEFRGLNNDEHC